MISNAPQQLLVVEDNLALSHVLKFNLQRAGFLVDVATTGPQAIELLKANTYLLAICDFQLPGASGEEIIECARQELNLTIPILVCTAKGYEIDQDRFFNELQVTQILRKPFSPQEVVELVTALLTPTSSVSS